MTRREVPLGAPVVTADGERLGTVKDVRGGAFKLDAAGQPDYWLPTSCLTDSGSGHLTVEATMDRIGELKVDEPQTR